ncbi:uncharacterized protein LOC128955223 [Oppia nitens]|uniref:uncharacterized protein LOC128955223 n=1 Tax=Oppia nitens TaxID=1686743 RepID=UPI0023DB7177|nr:uncharacterized protein LOC128955223 [Oppia nitens]
MANIESNVIHVLVNVYNESQFIWNQCMAYNLVFELKSNGNQNVYNIIMMSSNNRYNSFIGKLRAENLEYQLIVANSTQLIAISNNSAMKYMKTSGEQFDYNSYHQLSEINDELKRLANSYGDIVELFSLGKTYENRDILAVKVSNNNNSDVETDADPLTNMTVFDCGIHAREWISPAVCLWFIRQLTETDRYLLDGHQFVIIPVLNPDGYHYTWTVDRYWRKNRQNSKIKDCVGIDLNRNWPTREFCQHKSSDDPCDTEIYCGDRPFSALEIKHLNTFMLKHRKQLTVYMTFHSYSQIWAYPYSYTNQTTENDMRLSSLSKLAVDTIRQTSNKIYTYGSSASIMYSASGSSIDYVYDSLNVSLCFTVELRDTGEYGFLLPANQIQDTAHEIWTAIKAVYGRIVVDDGDYDSNVEGQGSTTTSAAIAAVLVSLTVHKHKHYQQQQQQQQHDMRGQLSENWWPLIVNNINARTAYLSNGNDDDSDSNDKKFTDKWFEPFVSFKPLVANTDPSKYPAGYRGPNEVSGSGTIMDRNGLVVASNRSLQLLTVVIVRLNSGSVVTGRVIYRNALYDLAVVKLDGDRSDWPTPVRRTEPLSIGDPVLTVANQASNLYNYLNDGIVCRTDRKSSEIGQTLDPEFDPMVELIQHSAFVGDTDWGTALVDSNGQFIGITIVSDRTNNLCLPAKFIDEFLANVKSDGLRSFGLLTSWYDPSIRSDDEVGSRRLDGIPADACTGLLVEEIFFNNNNPNKKDLNQYDIITHINGLKLLSIDDVLNAIEHLNIQHESIDVIVKDMSSSSTVKRVLLKRCKDIEKYTFV